ncbi:hypothetical protein RRF57_011702 [Xylaria bambusicola]|uniref:Uncharacterized protein n=1 Tax=Xylaria bambusicola TaxID=326684 RepID=A0AAN7Z3X8_9PEZI
MVIFSDRHRHAHLFAAHSGRASVANDRAILAQVARRIGQLPYKPKGKAANVNCTAAVASPAKYVESYPG